MILTGKCREDFIKHIISSFRSVNMTYSGAFRDVVIEVDGNDLYYRDTSTLILDFLDSVGIYINVYSQTSCVGTAFNFTIEGYSEINTYQYYPTRQQATEQAIKQATEIYNSRK